MLYEAIDSFLVNSEDLPWIPFAPHSGTVEIKYVKCNPVTGEMLTMLRMPAGTTMARQHRTGMAIVGTLQGAWKYKEREWTARPGSFVFETASSRYTPEVVSDEDAITINVTQGELLYLDDDDGIVAIENWKTGLQRYLNHCQKHGIAPRDLTGYDA